MKTLRIHADLEERLERAAAVKGETLSEFIRRAAAERADATLTAAPSERFADVLGAVQGGGGQARRTGEAFGELLGEGKPKG